MNLQPKTIEIDSIEAHRLARIESENLDTEPRFQFITGPAGSGKSFSINKKSNDDPEYIELGATTGIAAINIGTRTIHSILKFYNTKSLRDKYIDGYLQLNLRKIRERKRNLGIEEISMFGAEALDIIFDAIHEINNDANPRKLGLHIIGDICQLPVISNQNERQEMVFKAKCWPEFEKNTIKLNKIWRQDNLDFVEAINFVRSGNGKEAVPRLINCGVTFVQKLDNNFDGTTLIPKNAEVNDFNNKRLAQLPGDMIRVVPTRRGEQLTEWKPERDLIPAEQRFKVGALVMILTNETQNWSYVNGDLAEILEYDKVKNSFKVKLKRTGNEVQIGILVRQNLSDKAPTHKHFSPNFDPYVDHLTSQWVIGEIKYHPIRLAYASSIHKSQGLSLDRVQIDSTPSFFGASAMSYVSISRARTPEGLIIVGTPQLLERRIYLDKEVKRFI